MHIFTGPSLWAPWPCVRVRFRVESARFGAPELEATAAGLASCLTDVSGINTADVVRGAGELVARASIALQARVGPAVQRFAVSPEAGGCAVSIGYVDAEVSRVATSATLDWIGITLRSGEVPDPRALLEAFDRAVEPFRLRLEQRLLLSEITRRSIPWRRVHNVHLLGWGSKRRLLSRLTTDATPSVSVSMATHKQMAASMMAGAGIPTPRHARASSPAQAAAIAGQLGYPVVLKPLGTDMGVGVHLDLRSAEEVTRTYPEVARHGPVLVERQQPGQDHRLLVIGGRLIAAARRVPAHVIGDDRQTVRALVDAVNADPRRGVAHSGILERVRLDDRTLDVLARQGLGPDSVPAQGQIVQLALTANLSTGGTSIDVTSIVHPDNRLVAERAARVIGLDIAGVDFITPDIARSHREVGGIVCEINPNPGLRPHLAAPGSPDVVPAIIDAMFPGPDAGRIPTAIVTGTVGKTTTCRMTAAMLRAAGRVVGLATTDGVQIDDAWIVDGDEAGPRGAGFVLSDPSVTAAVLETARGGILKHGIGPDRCDVAAVLNVGTDHVGTDGIRSISDLARIKSTVLHAATRAWVLNADDPHCLQMARAPGGPDRILVGRDARSPALARHIDAGGVTVVLDAAAPARIIARRGTAALLAITVDEIPAAFGGAAEFNVENAMFAIAIGVGLGLPVEEIRNGLSVFQPDGRWSRSRANLHRVGSIQVLLDYAHNLESFVAIGRFAARLPVEGRRLLLLDVPGDRTEQSFDAIGRSVASLFDRVVCSTSLPRGRAPGETARLLAESLRRHGLGSDRIEGIEPFDAALTRLLEQAVQGDLLVIPVDRPEQVLEHPALHAHR